MDKKWLIGVKIFGIIFIFWAGRLINSPVSELMFYSSHKHNNPYSLKIYHIYQAEINNLEDYKEDYPKISGTIATEANKMLFAKQLTQLKQEAETFRQKFIVQGQIPTHAQVFISIGFMTCFIFILTGFGLIMHFLWARKLAMWSMLLGFLFYLSRLFNLYLIVDVPERMLKKDFALEALLAPLTPSQNEILHNNNFWVFLHPTMWLGYLPLALYSICVIYFFTRPKVKEEFKR